MMESKEDLKITDVTVEGNKAYIGTKYARYILDLQEFVYGINGLTPEGTPLKKDINEDESGFTIKGKVES